eukprot:scaffold5918_cov130-Cylindrotheca_fusiformis.AAC.4
MEKKTRMAFWKRFLIGSFFSTVESKWSNPNVRTVLHVIGEGVQCATPIGCELFLNIMEKAGGCDG